MTDVSTTKSIFALTVVVGCFAVLWPKIFFPMMQAAFRIMVPGNEENEIHQQKPPNMHPGMGEPLRKPDDSIQRKPGRPPIPRHPGHVYNQPSQSSQSGGVMGMIMPVYTIGVILFFFYTLFKVMSKKPDKTPKLKNFNMDPEHRKFVYSEEYDGDKNLRRKAPKLSDMEIPETEEEEEEELRNPREDELEMLRKRLADTEVAMAKILKQMGDTSKKLSSTVPEQLKNPLLKNTDATVSQDNSKNDDRGGTESKTSSNDCENDEQLGAKETKVSSLRDAGKGHLSKDSTPDTESYEVVGAKDNSTLRRDICKSNTINEDSGDECIEETQSNCSSIPSSSNEDKMEDTENEQCSHIQTTSNASTSSFEYISSCENTPLSPEKDLNLEKIVEDADNTDDVEDVEPEIRKFVTRSKFEGEE